jgi:hypothetical protein
MRCMADERDRTEPHDDTPGADRPDGTGTKETAGAASGYDGGGLSNTGEITGAGGGPGTAGAANVPHDRPQAGSPAPEDVRSDAP